MQRACMLHVTSNLQTHMWHATHTHTHTHTHTRYTHTHTHMHTVLIFDIQLVHKLFIICYAGVWILHSTGSTYCGLMRGRTGRSYEPRYSLFRHINYYICDLWSIMSLLTARILSSAPEINFVHCMHGSVLAVDQSKKTTKKQHMHAGKMWVCFYSVAGTRKRSMPGRDLNLHTRQRPSLSAGTVMVTPSHVWPLCTNI